MSCKKCGMCCRAIYLAEGMKELQSRHYNESSGDGYFIVNNWIEISKEEAFKINPYLQRLYKIKEYHFYTCKQFDEKNNLCKIHDNNPHVCNKYPFYGNRLLSPMFGFYTNKCGYNDLKYLSKIRIRVKDLQIDVERDIIWDGIKYKEIIDIDFGGKVMLQFTYNSNIVGAIENRYTITNGVNGYGENCFEEYKNEKIFMESVNEDIEK
jgi:Fe-S-cluster containining protein